MVFQERLATKTEVPVKAASGSRWAEEDLVGPRSSRTSRLRPWKSKPLNAWMALLAELRIGKRSRGRSRTAVAPDHDDDVDRVVIGEEALEVLVLALPHEVAEEHGCRHDVGGKKKGGGGFQHRTRGPERLINPVWGTTRRPLH